MNSLNGIITEIKTNGSLSLVKLDVSGSIFSAIVIDTPKTASYLAIGKKVSVVFKETEVVMGTGNVFSISLQNRLVGKVSEVLTDTLLSKIVLDTQAGKIVSVITTRAVLNLGLHVGADAVALIKTNEIMLTE